MGRHPPTKAGTGRPIAGAAGKCPASPTLEGGVKGHNIERTVPYREAAPFRAWSFTSVCRGREKEWED